jgi:hypothetical protein
VKKLLLAVLAGLALAAGPAGAATPTLQLTILHVVSGCHVWATAALKQLGPKTTITVRHGTRVNIRPNCPMDFDFAQVKGPRVALGAARTYRGTTRTLVFKKAGTYVFTARNVQTPEEAGLQTLGEPNSPITLTVKVT